MNEGYEPVYARSRGGRVESVHFGAGAVVDAGGRLLFSFGDPQLSVYLRSSAKPFQALPFAEHGGPGHFKLTPKELALLCASHQGTDEHVETAAAIQAKIGIGEPDLGCGIHPPGDRATRARMEAAGEAPTANRHNCSGKHTGMLACCRLMDWPLETYLDRSHPLQVCILETLAAMSDFPMEAIGIGTDGCSAPNFSIPLYNAALAFARLSDPSGLPERRRDGCRSITTAMTAHPEMVAGRGEFDTCMMEAGGGNLVSKGGAEGYQAVGLLPWAAGGDSPGIGIVLKVSDGDPGGMVRTSLALAILKSIGALDHSQAEELAAFGPERVIKNYRGVETGAGAPLIEFDGTGR
ncbi:MAG TPA: asparaginase [Anaerolineales bacterium]|nr:asparaginase [Anaerolineales bacterium]